MSQTSVGTLFIILGILHLLFPRFMLSFRISVARILLGAKVIPSKRTLFVYRVFGIIFILVGLLFFLD